MIFIKDIEQARNNLLAAIDEERNQNLIYDVGVITGTIIDFLKRSAQNIKNSASQDQIPADLIKSVLEHLENFHVLSTQYYVRVATKYAALVGKIDEFTSLRTKDFSTQSSQNLSQIAAMKKDWKEYEPIDTKVCDAAEEFGRDVATIVANIISYQSETVKNCKLFAARLQMFVDVKEGIFIRFNELLQQQRTVHIPRALQISQSLIEKKQPVFMN